MLKDLIQKNRSYRRFDQSKPVSRETLIELIDLARLSASAANLQNLRFWLIDEANEELFSGLTWANYLQDWDGPAEGEKPPAYILVLAPRNFTKFIYFDTGIACQSILLGATERGLGGCMLASVDKDKVQMSLGIPEEYEIILAVALGTPAEEVIIDDADRKENIEYWRDKKDRHRVPKLPLKTLILN